MAAVLSWSTLAAAGDGSVAQQEATIPGGTLVIVGYVILWVMLGGYLLFVMWRQRRLQDDIDALEERIDEAYGVGEDVEAGTQTRP